MNINYFYGKTMRSNIGKNYTTTWNKFIELFKNPIIQNIEFTELQKMINRKTELQNPITETEKEEKKKIQTTIANYKDVHYIIGGNFAENKRSNGDDTLLFRNLIALDIDNCNEKIWEKIKVFNKYEYLLHSSFSHSPNNPKLRLFIPIRDNISNKNDYINVVTNIITYNGFTLQNKTNVNGEIDMASLKFNQLMFLPNIPKNGEYIYKHNSGEFLDISKYKTIENTIFNIPEKNNKISPYEMKESSFIRKFCLKYDIHQCIKIFLPDIYIDRKDNRYTYVNGSSQHGAVVYSDSQGHKNVYLYTNHGSDPLNDLHCHNSFDLIQEHKFNGNLEATLQWVKTIFKSHVVDKNVDKNINLDLESVKWHPDYTYVKYEDPGDTEKNKKTQRLSDFFSEFPNNTGPEIKSITPLPVTENVKCLLTHYNIKIKFNIIKNSFDVFENDVISKYNLENFLVVIRDNADKQSFKITKDKITDIIIKIALDNEYNPIEDYLKKSHKYYLKNSDKDIFNKLMNTINSDSEWKNKFIGKFLLQMIYLGVSKEDTQVCADYMLVLQGKQFIGKTTWLRNLLPKQFRAKYFLGGRTLDPTNKDDRIETVTNWLVEMGEISSTFRKADQEALKNFITDYKDKFRLPYAKEALEKKRRTSLCGSTNDIEYLKDLTGTRRFLTLNCISFDKETKIDIDMLWGYMYSLYLNNVSYKFTNEEVEQIIIDNEKYLNKPEKLLIIEDTWNLNPDKEQGQWKTGAEIFAELPPQTLLNKFTIGRELKKNNIKWKRDKHLMKDIFYVSRKYSPINVLADNNIDNEPF